MSNAIRPGGKTVGHPARYSTEVIVLLRWLLKANTRVHDPFAGTGERLGSMADDRALVFTGTDIEPEFIVDRRVVQGDATDQASYPEPSLCVVCGCLGDVDERSSVWPRRCTTHHPRGYTIVTSPVYPNGMADYFQTSDPARNDRTYRHAKAKITGNDAAELDPNNMGRWGYRGKSLSSPARMMYWHLARNSVGCWGDAERVIVNVSDFMAGDVQVPVVGEWQRLLVSHGWVNQDVHEVPTKRFGFGANRDQRAANEVVIDARK